MIITINLSRIAAVFLFITVLFSEGTAGNYISLPLIAALMFLYFKQIVNFSIYALKHAFLFKFLVLFIFFVILGFVFNFLYNGASFTRFLIGFGGGYFLFFICCFLLGCVFAYNSSVNKIKNFFIMAFYVLMLAGIIEFILYRLNIQWFENVNLFCSGRTAVFFKDSGFPRIQSFFAEPSHYAWFLAVNIPFIMEICREKFYIFKNEFLNKFIHRTIVPLMLISLFCTQSPINLIAGIGIFLLYFFLSTELRSKIKILCGAFVLSLICLLFFGYFKEMLQDAFLNRISNAVPDLFDLKSLIWSEPSLATRLISYSHMFLVFVHYPFFGVSPGNLAPFFANELIKSNIPLTLELAALISALKINLNPSIFFKILSETGITGIICFMSFFACILNTAFTLIKKSTGADKIFFRAVCWAIITYIALMFYDSQFYNHYFWILFGAAAGFYAKRKKQAGYKTYKK